MSNKTRVILFLFVGPGSNANERMLSDAMSAVSSGDKDRIKKIITQNSDQDFKNKLLWEAGLNKKVEIVNILLDRGADANYQPENGRSACNLLIFSISSNCNEIMTALLKHGADPDAGCGGEESVSPLSEAISNQNLEAIQLLLENKADPYGVYQSEIEPALIDAISPGKENVVKILLSKGIDPNTLKLYNGKVSTALRYALDQNNKSTTIINMLKSSGAKDTLSEAELNLMVKNHKSERMRKTAAFALQQMKSIR
jgi:ankyrin repeat protein